MFSPSSCSLNHDVCSKGDVSYCIFLRNTKQNHEDLFAAREHSHMPLPIWTLFIPISSFFTVASLFSSTSFASLLLSHGCCKHCPAVGRFSGAKSSRGHKKSANSWASESENLYFSTSSLSNGQNLSLRILFKSPCRSKYSFDRDPEIAIWVHEGKYMCDWGLKRIG